MKEALRRSASTSPSGRSRPDSSNDGLAPLPAAPEERGDSVERESAESAETGERALVYAAATRAKWDVRVPGFGRPDRFLAESAAESAARMGERTCGPTRRGRGPSGGIVCIPPVRGEPSAEERVLQLLTAAFGDAWSARLLARLLTEAGSPTLDDWLRNRFFERRPLARSPGDSARSPRPAP